MYNKVGIYFIFQPREITATIEWLNWVSPQFSERTQMFGLANGKLDTNQKNRLEEFQHLNLTYSDENLGVAGGRNIVISEAMKWGAELLISLDNDILVPKDYFSQMEIEYSKLKVSNPNVGIIAPAIFDINRMIEVYPLEELKELFLGQCSKHLQNDILEKKSVLAREDYFYHLGVSGWKGCYLVSPLFGKYFEDKKFVESVLSRSGNGEKYKFVWHRNEKGIRDRILEGNLDYVKAHTLPGGLHVYESNYIENYGQFDERFNPYGFEDSEMCIRGVEDCAEHYLIGSVFVAHDLDQRFENRDPSITFFTRGKVRRILMKKFVNDRKEKWYLWMDTFILFPKAIFESSNESIFRKLKYCFNVFYGFLFVPRKRFSDYLGKND